MPVTLSHDQPDFEARFAALLAARSEAGADVDAVVAEIIADVRARGLVAVIELTRRFDRLELTEATLAFTAAEIDAAIAAVPQAERAALELAAARIRAYHQRQLPEDASWEDATGVQLGWRWTPVDAAGLYVPGGRSRRSTASAAPRRSPPWPTAPGRSGRWTRSPAPATPTWQRPSAGSSARSGST